MERNDDMIPQTVPNRPTKGAVDATVASTSRPASSFSTSRAMETSRTFSSRACRPMKELVVVWKERFHSRMAATKHDAMPIVGRCAEVWYSSSSDWPDQKTCSNRSIS